MTPPAGASAPAPQAAPGSPLGRRALAAGSWFAPAPWLYWVATCTWFVLVLRQWPCVQDASAQYRAGCYSDITALWSPRGFDTAAVPYFDADLEYPVLTGGFIHVSRLLLGALPIETSWQNFLGLSAVLLFGCFLALVAAHVRLAADAGRGWDALMIAASPLVVASGLINWDLLPVALTSLALLAWARRRPWLAGVLIGLGTAAKLYPVLLLGALLVLCLRAGRLRPALQACAGAVLAWLVVNLPVLAGTPTGWLHFWTFNAERAADLGSLWYVLAHLGWPVPNLSAVMLACMVLGGLVVVGLAMVAPRRPRVAQVAFLLVWVFCLFSSVYSPQYMLWLLPLLVLARPVWRDWALFTAAELVYWLAVWSYLDGALYAGDGRPVLYFVAILVRVGVQVWLAALVVRDMLRPWQDPVRVGHLDDPGGGVLDHAPDASAFPVTTWPAR